MDATTTADLLRPVLLDLADVVDHISPDLERAPTPCTEFDVAALRDHAISWLTVFAAGFAEPDGRAPVSGIGGYRASTAPGDEVRAAAVLLDAAVRAGGADRQLFLGESGLPAEMAISMILWEYLVHGWDLARATAQHWEPDRTASAAALEFAPLMLTPDYQGAGKPFGPRVEIPPAAPVLDQLLGLSGRDPAWSAPGQPG